MSNTDSLKDFSNLCVLIFFPHTHSRDTRHKKKQPPCTIITIEYVNEKKNRGAQITLPHRRLFFYILGSNAPKREKKPALTPSLDPYD